MIAKMIVSINPTEKTVKLITTFHNDLGQPFTFPFFDKSLLDPQPSPLHPQHHPQFHFALKIIKFFLKYFKTFIHEIGIHNQINNYKYGGLITSCVNGISIITQLKKQDSSYKCNFLIKHIIRCFKIKSFSWSIV